MALRRVTHYHSRHLLDLRSKVRTSMSIVRPRRKECGVILKWFELQRSCSEGKAGTTTRTVSSEMDVKNNNKSNELLEQPTYPLLLYISWSTLFACDTGYRSHTVPPHAGTFSSFS